LLGTEGKSYAERRAAIIANPDVADEFFVKKIERFIKDFFRDTLLAEWVWYRFEFQARGSVHGHGAAKLASEPSPGLHELCRVALRGFLAEKEQAARIALAEGKQDRSVDSDWVGEQLEDDLVMDMFDDDTLADLVARGYEASAKVTRYNDRLISASDPMGPCLPGAGKPAVNPTNQRYGDFRLVMLPLEVVTANPVHVELLPRNDMDVLDGHLGDPFAPAFDVAAPLSGLSFDELVRHLDAPIVPMEPAGVNAVIPPDAMDLVFPSDDALLNVGVPADDVMDVDSMPADPARGALGSLVPAEAVLVDALLPAHARPEPVSVDVLVQRASEDQDYSNLQRTVQRHTICTPFSCLRNPMAKDSGHQQFFPPGAVHVVLACYTYCLTDGLYAVFRRWGCGGSGMPLSLPEGSSPRHVAALQIRGARTVHRANRRQTERPVIE